MFDTMCRLSEGGRAPDLERKLRYASLLKMPGVFHSEDSLQDDFRMLWKSMVVEDDEGCVFIERSGRLKVTETLATYAGHGVVNSIVAHPVMGRISTERCTTKDVGVEIGDMFTVATAGVIGDAVAMTFGEVVSIGPFHGDRTRIAWLVYELKTLAERSDGTRIEQVWREGSEDLAEVSAEWLKTVSVGMSQCMIAARPGTWVLRELSSRDRNPERSVKVPRSHQRPRWIVISDEERVRHFRSPTAADESAGHREVTPHPRRAHYRHIGTGEDGSKRHTWVRACWVGSTEAEIRGARYRVELEL
jgi:hypothetical protein